MKFFSIGLLVTLATAVGTHPAIADISTSKPSVHRDRSPSVGSAKSLASIKIRASSSSKSTPSYRSNPVTMNNLELAIYQQVNQYRQSRNLPPLVIDSTISAQARAHSSEMAKTGNLSHNGFNDRITAVSQKIGYRNAAENVAYNQGYGQPDVAAVRGWVESPGHHRNMIGSYDLTGIGVTKNERGEYYFTQIFIRQ